MIYREVGQFKTSYADDQAIFPVTQDRWGMVILLIVAFVVVPLVADDYWLRSVLIPFLIFSLAAMGLNILTGSAGLLSLGTAGFMAVGAFAAYNVSVRLPWLSFFLVLPFSGLCAAVVGILFGFPSLRIKGFYLAVATLAAQFFLEWLFTRVPWFTNYSSSGVISATPIVVLGYTFASSTSRYVLTLTIVSLLAILAKNMLRSATGRAWNAIRDMDIAAEIIGIRPLQTKLLAFAISSFYCGIAGMLWVYVYLGTVEPQAFDLARSFEVLFMIIIGGLGTILGSFLGAAFIVLLPILLNNVAGLLGGTIRTDMLSNLELIVFGTFIIVFLIVEPLGLARLWQVTKEKLRLWPFPY